MNDIKSLVIKEFGGVGIVAVICGVTHGAVSQWKVIPSRHIDRIVNAAKERGLETKIHLGLFYPNLHLPYVTKKSRRNNGGVSACQ